MDTTHIQRLEHLRGCMSLFRLPTKGLLVAAFAAAIPAEVTWAQSDSVVEEVVVTGYRGSLLNSTNAKRNSVGFSDEIFSDDIGKLPSQNLAESLNRIPGVKINRDVTGEGQQISVRGLGPSFTKIVLNGNNIAVASDGNLTGTNSNREVDLDIFPAELFSSLAVAKTPTASQLEGGTSGYVDLRTMRPFDNEPGQHFRFSAEGAYTDINEKVSPILSAVYSNTFNDRFGVLFGVVGSRKNYRVDGYETIGFSDGCVAVFTDPPVNANSNCDTSGPWVGRNHFMYTPYATADYVAAHPELGLAVGDIIDPVATSGLSREQLDRGIIPYLGRGMFTIGDRDATSALASFQYRPNDDMDFAVDVLYAETERNFDRVEAMNWGRRNFLHLDAAWIPENLTVNSDQVVTGGTLYNTHAWVGQRAYREDFDFISFMPSMTWAFTDTFQMELSASYTDSSFERDEPYFNFLTPGMTVDFSGLGDVPRFDYGLDISRPDIGWVWNDIQGDQIRFQRNFRETESTGVHADFALGEDPDRTGLRFGIAYDEASRDLEFYGGGNNDPLKANHLFPSDAYANIGNYLVQSPVSDLGSVFDNSVGYSGIAMLDVGRFMDAINYDSFVPTESGTGDQFGQGVGGIEEEMIGLYVEANAEADILGQPLRMNAGVRWVETDQTLTSLAGDGTAETNAKYGKFLPSFNATYDVTEAVKVRASASRTMTRANPGEMYPNSVWTSSGIDTAQAGNPNLQPFESINFDIGAEYYYGELGYVSLSYFEKEITGFTRSDTVDVLFQDLDALYGLDTSDISESQQDALDACGGPSSCTVQVSTRTNVQGAAILRGFEGIWVMPLDFVVEGLGFNASVTKINQSADDEASIITGISDWTYNWTGYYETELFQARVTYYHQDGAVASGFQGYDGTGGFPARRIRSDDRTQVDFSASMSLPWLDNYGLTLTFDGYNITNEPVRNLFEHDDLSYDIFYPGATYTLGLRAAF
jgi:TonB-dependent receptor